MLSMFIPKINCYFGLIINILHNFYNNSTKIRTKNYVKYGVAYLTNDVGIKINKTYHRKSFTRFSKAHGSVDLLVTMGPFGLSLLLLKLKTEN